MHSGNAAVIERFYGAFARRDGDEMAACYAPMSRFSDPAFGDLSGEEAGDMWRMLTSRGEDLVVELVEHDADETMGSARWIARYTFTQTGRKVVNDVRADFVFRDGLIEMHLDHFSFWRWSRQALGAPGLLLGWTPMLRSKVRSTARGQLEAYRSQRAAAP